MIKVSAVQHLNTWSPIVDAVWRSFEGMAFLDKRTTGVGFKSLKTLTTSSPLYSASCLWFEMWALSPQLLQGPHLPVATLPPCDGDGLLFLWNCKPKQTLPL